MGVLNAAVWCGSSIFVFAALPALFTPGMKHLLTDAGVGYAAEAIFSRFFILQYCCAAIAIVHMVVDWLYYGRQIRKSTLGVMAVVVALILAGGLWAQPKMRNLHVAKYFGNTPEKQAQAGRAFGRWHAASESANLIILCGLVWYLWRVTKEKIPERFVSFNKIRG